jgi:hypothetical protein
MLAVKRHVHKIWHKTFLRLPCADNQMELQGVKGARIFKRFFDNVQGYSPTTCRWTQCQRHRRSAGRSGSHIRQLSYSEIRAIIMRDARCESFVIRFVQISVLLRCDLCNYGVNSWCSVRGRRMLDSANTITPSHLAMRLIFFKLNLLKISLTL